MKKITANFLLLLTSWGIFQPATILAEEQNLPSGTVRNQISQKIEEFVKAHEDTTAGMSTAVFDKDGNIYQGNFGYMDKEKGIKVDNDSVFEWGSTGKLTIWVSIM
jgi:beta-lactamase